MCLCDVNTKLTLTFPIAVALGAVATPNFFEALPKNRDLDIVRRGYLLAGGVLVAAGLLRLALSGVVGVVLLFPLVLVYSAFIGAAGSIAIAGVQAGIGDGDALQRVSVFFIATFLALAMSGLSWGTVFDTFWGPATVVFNGPACIA